MWWRRCVSASTQRRKFRPSAVVSRLALHRYCSTSALAISTSARFGGAFVPECVWCVTSIYSEWRVRVEIVQCCFWWKTVTSWPPSVTGSSVQGTWLQFSYDRKKKPCHTTWNYRETVLTSRTRLWCVQFCDRGGFFFWSPARWLVVSAKEFGILSGGFVGCNAPTRIVSPTDTHTVHRAVNKKCHLFHFPCAFSHLLGWSFLVVLQVRCVLLSSFSFLLFADEQLISVNWC